MGFGVGSVSGFVWIFVGFCSGFWVLFRVLLRVLFWYFFLSGFSSVLFLKVFYGLIFQFLEFLKLYISYFEACFALVC